MNTLLSNQDLVFLFNLLLVLGATAGLLWLWYRLVHYVSVRLQINRLFSFVLFGVTILFFRAQIAPFCDAIAAFVTYPYGVPAGQNVLKHAMESVRAGRTTSKLGDIIVLCLSAFTLWSFAVWALARIITYTRQKLAENPKVDVFDQYITKAFLVTALFLVALFLVISTIIAVPEFQGIETSLDVDKLEQEFNADFDKRVDPALANEANGKIPEADLRRSLDSLRREEVLRRGILDSLYAPGTGKRSAPGALIANDAQLQGLARLEQNQGALLMLVSEYNKLVDGFIAIRESQSLNLQNQYLTEVSKGMSERSRRFYRSLLFNEGMSHLQRISTALILARSNIVNDTRNLRYYVNAPGVAPATQRARNRLDKVAALLRKEVKLPSYDAAGSLSVFGFMARWLLQTRSLSLALIVGMFGFGLLGAISSSYIRVNIRRAGTPGKPEKKGKKVTTEDVLDDLDLRSLLITGITAAVIIFLSVKGALVVLTASESNANINPYVLFFICFAAALYNEEVWQWVLEKFRGYMRNEPPANAEAAPADDAPKPKFEPVRMTDVFTPSLTPDAE
ncbi:MAG TPA: hypothetical protein VF646_02505, partial [Cytophagales bacterium]